MKELVSCARNHHVAIRDDGKTAAPLTEVVLVLSEPKYKVMVDGAGRQKLTRYRAAEEVRFSANLEGLRALAAEFAAWADELARVSVHVNPGGHAGATAKPPVG